MVGVTACFASIVTMAVVSSLFRDGLDGWSDAVRDPNKGKFRAILSLPIFGWPFLIILTVSRLEARHWSALYVWAGWALMTVMVGVCWKRSKILADRARNPLRGILESCVQPADALPGSDQELE